MTMSFQGWNVFRENKSSSFQHRTHILFPTSKESTPNCVENFWRHLLCHLSPHFLQVKVQVDRYLSAVWSSVYESTGRQILISRAFFKYDERGTPRGTPGAIFYVNFVLIFSSDFYTNKKFWKFQTEIAFPLSPLVSSLVQIWKSNIIAFAGKRK